MLAKVYSSAVVGLDTVPVEVRNLGRNAIFIQRLTEGPRLELQTYL